MRELAAKKWNPGPPPKTTQRAEKMLSFRRKRRTESREAGQVQTWDSPDRDEEVRSGNYEETRRDLKEMDEDENGCET